MTTAIAVGDSAYPTPDEIRDIILKAIFFAYQARGLVANVLPGSDHFIRSEKFAERVSVAIANGQLALAAVSPLSAIGQDLVDLAAVFGVTARPASPSAGPVTVRCTGTIVIPAGFTCTSPNGHRYETITLATLTDGETVDVISQETGPSTEQGEGTQVTWDSATIGALNPVAVVAQGGIVGGTDGDVLTNADGTLNVERLRQRLLVHLAFPPVGGNWSSVKQWAEQATAAVEFAFVYPAVRGPASYDVAVTKAGVSRVLTGAQVATVQVFVDSNMPGQNDLNVTSVTEQGVDVSIVAQLPLPQSAGGSGGGWRDPNPWPSGEDAKVTAYNSTTLTATVNSTAAPVVGQQIGIWDPDATDGAGNPAPVMREYVVATVGGSTGAWTLTVQNGFAASPLNAYVSAGAVHLVEYATDLAAQFLGLGPGEKTDSAFILPRGRRQPSTDVQSPAALSSLLLARVSSAHAEIEDLNYGVRYATGTTTTLTTPDIPLATSDPPNLLTLRYMAIRA